MTLRAMRSPRSHRCGHQTRGHAKAPIDPARWRDAPPRWKRALSGLPGDRPYSAHRLRGDLCRRRCTREWRRWRRPCRSGAAGGLRGSCDASWRGWGRIGIAQPRISYPVSLKTARVGGCALRPRPGRPHALRAVHEFLPSLLHQRPQKITPHTPARERCRTRCARRG